MACRLVPTALGLFFLVPPLVAPAGEPAPAVIDRLAAAAWARAGVRPAPVAGDAEFVRRVYLDLIGRIPTGGEAGRFLAEADPVKRARLIDELLAGGEFSRHWRENLHVLFTGGPPFAGDPAWRAWLEEALRQNKKWDEIARAILRGRADRPEEAGAAHFLISRLAQGDSGLDLVTRDVSRVFFGVDIQCARCHKHPDVEAWPQESYWGMAAFFNRSYVLPVKGRTFLAERATGDVEYMGKGKARRVARPVFLTGAKLAEPTPPPSPKGKPPAAGPEAENPADYLVPPEASKDKTRVPVPRFSRREKFVETAITPTNPYFKRAAVNVIWARLLGRGLVEPLDQMHAGNPPANPELLDFLADDFAAGGFDLRRLIRAIVNSRVYQLASAAGPSPRPEERHFSVGAVRPLSPHQLATSLLVAAGHYELVAVDAKLGGDLGAFRAQFEQRHAGLLAALVKDLGGAEPYQPGVAEALFQANNPAFADLVAKGGLAARLVGMPHDALSREAFLAVLSRPATPGEVERVRGYLRGRPGRRAAACEQLVWALLTASEFRFNH